MKLKGSKTLRDGVIVARIMHYWPSLRRPTQYDDDMTVLTNFRCAFATFRPALQLALINRSLVKTCINFTTRSRLRYADTFGSLIDIFTGTIGFFDFIIRRTFVYLLIVTNRRWGLFADSPLEIIIYLNPFANIFTIIVLTFVYFLVIPRFGRSICGKMQTSR